MTQPPAEPTPPAELAPPVVELTPLHPAYPSRLRSLPKAPESLLTRGGSLEADRVVAIVGSRDCTEDAAVYAKKLAADLAGLGVVVVSGGALGIDGAAHKGALAAGGRTWVVAGTGSNHVFPDGHKDLFEAVARGPGAMIWPFPADAPPMPGSFLSRNRVLVALADAVVVVQAGFPSGALRAATCARNLGKPLWVCPAPPWVQEAKGSRMLLSRPEKTSARPLFFEDAFMASLGLPPGASAAGPPPPPRRPLSSNEADALRGTSSVPLHLDEIASRAGLPAQAAAAALLTLALENVVVEGPSGFYRRRDER